MGGAIAGSLVTAWLAGRRLTRQLDHDRDMRDLEELRDVLDDATVVGADANRHLRALYILLTEEEEHPEYESLDEAIGGLRAMLEYERDVHAKFFASPPDVLLMFQRVRLRLGWDDEITHAYRAVYESLGAFLKALPDDPEADLETEQAAELEGLVLAAGEEMKSFVDAAHERVRVRAAELSGERTGERVANES
jgi:hypothetical protein